MPTKAELQVRVDELKKRTRASKNAVAGGKGIIRQIIARRTATSRYTRSSVPVDEVFWFTVGGFLVLRPSQMV